MVAGVDVRRIGHEPGGGSGGRQGGEGASDHELLTAFARRGDQGAFAEVVRRHVDWVYSCALRQVRDRHLAEDVVQVVFHVLARKAGRIGAGVVVSGWLFNATRFAAANALRDARRGARREQEAAVMNQATRQESAAAGSAWDDVAPHLEEGLAALPRHEREAVLLRYFEGRSLRETGATLGITEDAAAKRVSRAVERLRQLFVRKGVAAPAAAGLGAMLSANAVQAAPAGVVGTVAGAGASPAVVTAGDQVVRALVWAKAKGGVIGVAVAVVCAAVVVVVMQLAGSSRVPPGKPAAAKVEPVAVAAGQATTPPEFAPVALKDGGGGRAMKGFPIALPGGVVASAGVADVDGDGVAEIVVPTIGQRYGRAMAHPRPRLERLVHAIRPDGTALAGWPAVITDQATREAQAAKGGNSNNWGSAPSIADVDGDGREDVVILDLAGTVEIRHVTGGGPVVRRISNSGDGLSAAPLVDVDGDGRLDFVMGWVLRTIDGGPVAGWPAARMVKGGFAPAVVDVAGDGRPRLFLPSYVQESVVWGLDRFGRGLHGWPQRVVGQTFHVTLGDVDGDGTPEVGAVDSGRQLHLWTIDGQPLAATRAIGVCTSVFKTGLSGGSGGVTFADLDGDGADEVIVLDAGTIKAWRGDGRGLVSEDGTLAKLPATAVAWGGVSVVDLGDAGVIDLFAGMGWVRVRKGAAPEVIDLLPAAAEQRKPQVTPPLAADVALGPVVLPTVAAQPTVADVNGDGKADVVVGLTDGRVYVFETGKTWRGAGMIWPTARGNFRRTGARTAPRYVAAPPAVGESAAAVEVLVTDAETGAALAGAMVTAPIEDGQLPFVVDAQGKGVVPGKRPTAVWVSKAGYAKVRADLKGSDAGTVKVALPPVAAVGGFVRDGAGAPVAGARVYVSASGRTDAGREIDVRDAATLTDEEGRWSILAVPARCDAIYLRVAHPKYVTEESRVGRTVASRQALYARSAVTVLNAPATPGRDVRELPIHRSSPNEVEPTSTRGSGR